MQVGQFRRTSSIIGRNLYTENPGKIPGNLGGSDKSKNREIQSKIWVSFLWAKTTRSLWNSIEGGGLCGRTIAVVVNNVTFISTAAVLVGQLRGGLSCSGTSVLVRGKDWERRIPL